MDAAFSEVGVEVVMTADHMTISWPKKDEFGNDASYGQPTQLTPEQLLQTNLCMGSSNCNWYALQAGAVYYEIKEIYGFGRSYRSDFYAGDYLVKGDFYTGTGKVYFFYDEFVRHLLCHFSYHWLQW